MIPRVLFVGARPLPAAALPEPRAQVGRPLGADEPAGARERHRLGPPLRAPAADPDRRAALLRLPACPDRAPARHLQARRRDRPEPVRGVRRRDRLPRSSARLRRSSSRCTATGTSRLASTARGLAACSAPRATRSRAWPFAMPTPTAPSRASPRRCSATEGREPAAVFTTYSDLGAFSGPVVPVPDEPRVIFVGVLERYKNVEALAAGWRLAAAARARGAAAPDRVGDAGRDRGRPRARRGRVGAAPRAAGARGGGRQRPRAPAALRVRGAAAGGDRVVRARPRRDRLSRRWDPRHRRGRGERAARRAGRRLEPGRRRSRGSSPTTTLPCASAPRAAASSAAWVSSPDEYADRVRALVDAALAT